MAGVPLAGRNVADAVERSQSCRPTNDGRVLYHELAVPARSIASVRMTPTSTPSFAPLLRVLDACTAASCVADALGTTGTALDLVFANEGLAERRYLVAASPSFATTTAGTYDLSATVAAASAGQLCASAAPLTPAMARTGERLEEGRVAPRGCRLTGSPARFYAVTVGGGEAVTVRVTPTSTSPAWTPQLRLLDDCAATTCAADALGTSGVPLTLTAVNDSVVPRVFTAVVNASSTASTTGTYDIVATAARAAPGALCGAPVALSPSSPAPMQDTSRAGASSAACLTASTGPQLFYRVAVPPGQRVRVAAAAAAGTTASPVLRALDECAAASCVASVTGTAAAGAELHVPNFGASPRELVVSLGTTSRTLPGVYDLTAALAPAATGQFCERPLELAAGSTVMGDTSAGVVAPAPCGTAGGGQTYYRLRVPPARRVVVTATPGSTALALRLRAVTGCAATSCFTSNTTAAAGAPASITLTNATLSERQFVVSVASSLATTAGPFMLAATAEALTPPPGEPYAVAPITAACDPVAGATVIAPPGGWTDDSATAVTPLPFPLRFFATSATHYSVSSNGLVQLYAGASGSPSTTGVNGSIPSASAPNGMAAAFWDDLAPDASSTARAFVAGAGASRRFVVEWSAWRVLGDASSTLKFQAHFHEATGVVEYHYCPSSSAANDRALGASATVGVEDPTGTSASLVSLDWAGGTRPGTGWRLTPR